MGLVKAGKINVYLKNILGQFPKGAVNVSGPTITLEDNESAVKLLRPGGKQKRSRHFNLDFHILKEYIALNEIEIRQVPGLDNPADFFTKLLGGHLFVKHKAFIMGNPEFQAHFMGQAHRATAMGVWESSCSEVSAEALKTISDRVYESLSAPKGLAQRSCRSIEVVRSHYMNSSADQFPPTVSIHAVSVSWPCWLGHKIIK